MAYQNSILDIRMVIGEREREQFRRIITMCASKIGGKIVEVNSMIHTKNPMITTEDLELALLYTLSEVFVSSFKTYMTSVDKKESRYDISDSRFRKAEKYLKTVLGSAAFEREFTIAFDHFLQFFVLEITRMRKEHSRDITAIYTNLVMVR